MTLRNPSLLTPALLAGVAITIAGAAARAQTTPAAETPAAGGTQADQVVVPKVDRRDIRLPVFPSSDFEVGLFGGTHSTQNFGASVVGGLRLGYHITEDYFVEASLGRTQVSDAAFRRVLPGGIFTKEREKLQYANVSAGMNVLPGEVFFGRDLAMPYYLYVLGGVGTTSFNAKRHQTFNLGLGMKVFVRDWFAVRVDMQDHIFTLDLLGKREKTQNYELTAGVSFLF